MQRKIHLSILIHHMTPFQTAQILLVTQREDLGYMEQMRLKNLCDRLTEKRCEVFIIKIQATEYTMDLYQNYKIEIIQAKRAINSNPNKRGEVDEILVRNYD